MRTTAFVSALLVIALSACSGQPVKTNYYLLRTDSKLDSRDLAPSVDFAMGGLTVAAYLDQPGLVLETRPGEINPAMHHQWAEPLHDSLRGFIRVEVSDALGQDVFPADTSHAGTRFDVRIDQMHGTADGTALLVAYWWLRRDGEVVAAYQFAESKALAADGYLALADAEKALLVELSRRIAASLKEAG